MPAARLRSLRALALLAGFALMLRSAFPLNAEGADYFHDASGAIDALVRLDWRGFALSQPLMGPFSLLVRAPFAAAVFHAPLDVVYLAGALPCVGAVVALALVLRRRMEALGRPALAGVAVVAATVLTPGTFRALHWGHPEELLAGVLCVAAALAALRGRLVLAGLALGCALATKQWTLVAVVPVLLAAPRRPALLAGVAAVVALALVLPPAVTAPSAAARVTATAANARPVVTAPNVWWPVAAHPARVPSPEADHFAGTLPGWLAPALHPLIVLVALPLGWAFRRRRPRPRPEDALGLLALLLLLRCLLDPWNIDYYHAPFLLALVAWEALARDGWPKLTVLAGASLAVTFPATLDTQLAISAEALRYCVTYLAWALPLCAWLALAVLAPERLTRVRAPLAARTGRTTAAPSVR